MSPVDHWPYDPHSAPDASAHVGETPVVAEPKVETPAVKPKPKPKPAARKPAAKRKPAKAKGSKRATPKR